MDKIINWLMQPTSNGATLLQVILMSVFLVIVIGFCFKQLEEIIKIVREELKEEQEDAISKDM